MTGKTSYLGGTPNDPGQIFKAVRKYGAHRVMVCSFTKAAVQELNSRELPIPDHNLGTIHALAFRGLGHPLILEVPKYFKIFNENCPPSYKITAATREDVDDGFMNGGSAGEGDSLFRELQLRRALCQPQEQWPESVRGFANLWTEFKKAHEGMDFQDLIEQATLNLSNPPGCPDIAFLDECQDLSRSETRLIQKWAQNMHRVIWVGDSDQCLYRFKGADPEAFMMPIPPEYRIVLKQSYRVPRAIHAFAETWIKKIPFTHRLDREYLPRDYEGEVLRSNAHYKDPGPLLKQIEPYLAEGKRILFLASCSYMLQPLIQSLRDAGIAFSNPYRRARADWNPLHQGNTDARTSTAARVAAFLSNSVSWDLHWTGQALAKWLPLIKNPFKRGHKQKTLDLLAATPSEVPLETLANALATDTLTQARAAAYDSEAAALAWLQEHAEGDKAKGAVYACAVAGRYGAEALKPEAPEPLCSVGTIHSVKGGEADVVVLFPDLSYQGAQEFHSSAEGRYSILRTAYVGITRAKEKLILASPASRLAISW